MTKRAAVTPLGASFPLSSLLPLRRKREITLLKCAWGRWGSAVDTYLKTTNSVTIVRVPNLTRGWYVHGYHTKGAAAKDWPGGWAAQVRQPEGEAALPVSDHANVWLTHPPWQMEGSEETGKVRILFVAGIPRQMIHDGRARRTSVKERSPVG